VVAVVEAIARCTNQRCSDDAMKSKKKMKFEGFAKASFHEEQEENASLGNIF